MTNRHWRLLGAIAIVTIAAGGATGLEGSSGFHSGQPTVISGTVTYRQRIALTPAAVLEVSLEDVSKADAPADVIASRRLENPGQVPIRFELPYDASRILSTHRYQVRARITHKGTLRFTSTQAYPVLTGGHGLTVNILLQAAGAQGPPPTKASSVQDLREVDWMLVRVGTQAVEAGKLRRAPYLRFNAAGTSVAGHASCNTFRGGVELSGEQMSFPGVATTQMACPDMEVEQAFLKALGATATWRVTGSQLGLLDKAGAVVAVFEREVP
jgi:putative lipoprotein